MHACMHACMHARRRTLAPHHHSRLRPPPPPPRPCRHAFWDADSFAFPPLNLMWPRLASSLLLYRFHRLPGARVKARAYAGPGALAAATAPWASAAAFPWESAFSGVETCPPYAPTGEGEIHVSGDVSVAVWQHFCATGDVRWLAGVGFPVLAGVADFFLARALADSPGAVVEGANGRLYFSGLPPHEAGLAAGAGPLEWPLHLRGVIAATEFYRNVSDNALTNGVARLALRYAARAARVLGYDEAEWAHWDRAAARIVLRRVPAPAPARARAADGAAGEEGEGGRDHAAAAAALVYPYFEVYDVGARAPVQLLDVPMLHDMLGSENGEPGPAGAGAEAGAGAGAEKVTVASRRAAAAAAAEAEARFYLGAFEGGAAFAYALNSLTAARLGELAAAHAWFAKAHAGFVHGPFHVWTEYAGGTGCPNL